MIRSLARSRVRSKLAEGAILYRQAVEGAGERGVITRDTEALRDTCQGAHDVPFKGAPERARRTSWSRVLPEPSERRIWWHATQIAEPSAIPREHRCVRATAGCFSGPPNRRPTEALLFGLCRSEVVAAA